MLRSRFSLAATALSLLALGAGCAATADDVTDGNDRITSDDGSILELRFDGSVVADADTPSRQAIVSQLQYVQGLLVSNEQANGQVGLVTLGNVRESASGSKKTISYSASLPVVWPKTNASVPATYDIALPKDVTKLDDFNAKYDGKCGTNEYGQATFWHDWNPRAEGCKTGSDVVSMRASVRPHPQSTEGKFPEYDRVWADDKLEIAAVYGIISGSNTPDDEGAREMSSVIEAIAGSLTDAKTTENTPGASVLRDVTVTGSIDVGGKRRQVTLNAMLVMDAAAAGDDFTERFGGASETADFVVYSGHSGLGANINSIATRARVKAGQYQMYYLNGCQSFAYLGTALYDKKIAANGEAADPHGTKDLDIVANVLPAYGDNGSTTLSIFNAITGYTQSPKTYNDILRDFSAINLPAVFGEEDNVFSR